MSAQILLVFLLLALVSACGGGDGSGGRAQQVPIPEEQIDIIMANQVFACAPIKGDECPSGIARLFTIDRLNNENSHVCTGFMIGTKTLITNAHCVRNEEQCSNTRIAVYSGGGYLSTRCSRVVRSEEDYPEGDPRKSIDIAELELADFYSGESFELAEQWPSAGDRINVWAIDHTGIDAGANLFESRITEFNCEFSAQNSQPAQLLSSCPLIQGNSGSPALNQDGKVVGVIWGATATFNSNLDLSLRRRQQESAAMTEIQYVRQPP